MPHQFFYDRAFSRNLGWLTEWEQQALRAKRIAVAGMGGVGGFHLLTLVRFGVGAANIADLDRFDLVNFNRQIGATLNSVDQPKTAVLERMALDINPDLRIRRFDDGVTAETLDAFLDGVDLFVDGFDFFELEMRQAVFAACAERGIPAITAAPIGMGVGFLAFLPGRMTFEQYFRLEGHSKEEQYLRFLLGLAPRGLHRAYLVDPTRVDLAGHKGPSTVAGCELCAGVAGAAGVGLLLGRGNVRPAPFHYQFDGYRGRFAATRLRAGNAGPVQRLKLSVARRLFTRMSTSSSNQVRPAEGAGLIHEILNMARWAPSGDNAQPWRFRILDEETVEVHLRPQDRANPYEYRDGEPILLAGGMLLESLGIAASGWGRRMEWAVADGVRQLRLTLRFPPDAGVEPDPLLSYIPLRSVNRGAYRMRPLADHEKAALSAALGEDLALTWHETFRRRLKMAHLSALATGIRLRAEETFRIHRGVIDWNASHSPHGVPAAATGLWRSSLPLMRWAMQRWSRMRLLNLLGGTAAAALQMDYVPGMASGAYFSIRPSTTAAVVAGPERLLAYGRSLQRFWLTATRLGLAVQPAMAMLIFADLGASSTDFTADEGVRRRARALGRRFEHWIGVKPAGLLFAGRIGQPRRKLPLVRSSRRPLSQLMQAVPAAE